MADPWEAPMTLAQLQNAIRATYHERDAARGVPTTFVWFTEEVGELAKALRQGDPGRIEHELSDVLAWLTTLANLLGVDLEAAAQRFAGGCPKCTESPCCCPGEVGPPG